LKNSSELDLLRDIQERVLRAKVAQKYLALSETTSDNGLHQLAFDAILFYLVNIGESIRRLEAQFLEAHSGIPWHEIVGLRNRLAHDYNSINTEIVRGTLEKPLDQLLDFCVLNLDQEKKSLD
jgi:uncharacterized protein with HEPN domain